MKRIVSLVAKAVLTVCLFVLIFTELGAKYIPVPDPALTSAATETSDGEGFVYASAKAFLGRFRHLPPPKPIPMDEACGLAGNQAYVVRVPPAASGAKSRFLPLDVDLGCVGGKLQFFAKDASDGWRRMPREEATVAGLPVFVKTRGWWRVAPIKPRDLWDSIQSLDPSTFWPWILFATLAKLGGIFASLARWLVLLVGQGIRIPFRYLCGTFFTARFFGIFFPGTLGLDGYRLYDSIRITRKPVECTTVIAVEKIIGFVAVFGLVFLTLPLGLRALDIRKPSVLFGILGGLGLLISFALLILFSPRFVQAVLRAAPIPWKGRIQSKLDTVAASATAYSGRRGLLVCAILLGFVVHIGTILMYFGTMRAVMTIGVKPAELLFASSLTITGTVFGPTIGSAGVREIMFTWLLKDSAGAAKAFLFGHLGFWIETFFLSLPGAFVYLFRPSAYKPKLTVEDLRRIE